MAKSSKECDREQKHATQFTLIEFLSCTTAVGVFMAVVRQSIGIDQMHHFNSMALSAGVFAIGFWGCFLVCCIFRYKAETELGKLIAYRRPTHFQRNYYWAMSVVAYCYAIYLSSCSWEDIIAGNWSKWFYLHFTLSGMLLAISLLTVKFLWNGIEIRAYGDILVFQAEKRKAFTTKND